MNPKKNKNHQSQMGRPRTSAPLLPIYDSMAACSAATGIPMSVLKAAKAGGCSGFRSNRVDLGPVLQWIFQQDESSVDWGDEFEKWRAKREKIKHDKDADQVRDIGEVKDGANRAMSIVFSQLDRIFCSELPPALKGLTEIEIRNRSQKEILALQELLRAEFRKLSQQEVATDA